MTDFDAETLAADRFVLEERLGAGSTGTVYAAYDRDRGEKLALKVLTYRSAAALYRFKREFRALVDVVHPNLVAFYELFADDEEEVFFTMELVEGADILDHARPPRSGPAAGFDEERLRDAFRQLATGVKALHDGDKIHCDLKPNNVLADRDGRVVILDFGIARDLAPSVTPGSLYQGLAGTVPYMSPEQAKGESPRPASDWYAVGVMLFQAMTGRMPFEGSLVDVLSAKVSKGAPSLRGLVPELPVDLADLCADLLEVEAARRPSGAEVLARLGVVQGPSEDAGSLPEITAPGSGELAVIGRHDALADLRAAFETSRRNRAVAVFLHGESGMGKTALAQHFLHELARSSNAVVLAGRCYERELVPFKALDGIVDSLSRYLNRHHLTRRQGDGSTPLPEDVDALCRLFPVLERLEPIAEAVRDREEISDRLSLRKHAFQALRELLGGIAAERPLVLYIDDLHWADADSTALLSDLLRPPEAPPLLLLASFRSEEIAAKPFLQDLLSEAGSATRREVRLGPLDDTSAAELARSVLGDVAAVDPIVAAIVREAGGSPFLVEQLVGYAGATQSSLSGTIGFGEMLEARLGQLPKGAVGLLRTLAAAGRPLEAPVAYEAAGLEGDERPLIAALKAAHLVRASGSPDHVELFHNRIRETLAPGIDAAENRQVHARLAETLLRRGRDDPEALYEHFRQAGRTRRAGFEAARAAVKARTALAFDRAARFFRHALELGEVDATERQAWLEGLAETLSHAGRPGESASAYLELSRSADHTAAGRGMRALVFRQKAAEEYLAGGYFDEGLHVVREVGREVGLDLPAGPTAVMTSFVLNRLRVRLRGLRFELRDPDQISQEELLRADAGWIMAASLAQCWPVHGNVVQTRHLLVSLDTGDPVRISRALNLEASFRVANGAPPQRTARLRRTALELARKAGDSYAEGLCILHSGIAAYLSGRWSEGAEWCEKAEEFITEHHPGGVWEISQANRYGLSCRYYRGDFAELSRRVPELLAGARERGNVLVSTDLATRLNVVWLARDQPGEARRLVDEALVTWSRQGFHVPHFNGLISRCQADLYEGDRERALSRLLGEWPRLRRSLLTRLTLIDVEGHFLRGRAALAAAPRKKRLRLVRKAAARMEKTAYGAALAKLLRAGLARVGGDEERSAELLAQAAGDFEAQDMALFAAVARRRRGELQGGDEGREVVKAADSWMRAQRVVRPDRMTALLAPGFPDS